MALIDCAAVIDFLVKGLPEVSRFCTKLLENIFRKRKYWLQHVKIDGYDESCDEFQVYLASKRFYWYMKF